MADFNIPQLRNRRLSSLLADPSVMDSYQPTQPLSGLLDYSDPAVKAGPDAIGPPTIAGGLLSLDPTDYVGPQTLGKLAAGLKGLLAGGMVMGGVTHSIHPDIIKALGNDAPEVLASKTKGLLTTNLNRARSLNERLARPDISDADRISLSTQLGQSEQAANKLLGWLRQLEPTQN